MQTQAQVRVNIENADANVKQDKGKYFFSLRLHYVWTARTQAEAIRAWRIGTTNLSLSFPAIKMAAPDGEEKLAEAVRKFPVLYGKCCFVFKDKMKKALAWEDVAKMVGLQNDKLKFAPKISVLCRSQSTSSTILKVCCSVMLMRCLQDADFFGHEFWCITLLTLLMKPNIRNNISVWIKIDIILKHNQQRLNNHS